MGTVGLVAFAGVVAAVMYNAYRTRKLCAARPVPNDFLYHLVGGIRPALVMINREGLGSRKL
jgi:hypothetical protein